ncbi:MAG: acetyl-CoA carboxylase biotin carboxyl carrier protein subunit [Bacteroidota bacterium]
MQKDFSVLNVGNQCFIHTATIGNVQLNRLDRFPQKEKEKIKGGYESPMPSQIIKLHVAQGDEVKTGDPLLVISSMKMENVILAEEDGTIEEVYAEEGQNVEAGFLLLKVNS